MAVLKLQTCRREREKQRKERAVEVFFFFSSKNLEKSEREKRRIKKNRILTPNLERVTHVEIGC